MFFFRVLAITLHCDTVAVEGIGPSSRSPNECNPLGAFVTWCPRIPYDTLRHAYRQNLCFLMSLTITVVLR